MLEDKASFLSDHRERIGSTKDAVSQAHLTHDTLVV